MNENNIPPNGGLIEYHEPHSPFQKLIDSQRERYGLSGRELAEKIGVSQSTLWIWLHNRNGFPDPKSFNSEHVRRLAEVLKISELEIKAALEASRPFDALGRFIEIFENDNRQTVSKSYVLNIAKNLYRGLKVTLLVLVALLLLGAVTHADELQTFVTIKGDRFEKAHVTEVTPATITIVHSAGVATLPLSEFPVEVQKRFNYDPDKAKAWLDQIAREEKLRRDQEQAARAAAEKQAVEEKRRSREAVDQISHYLDDGGRLEYDPATHQFYDPDIAAARRHDAIKFYRRYGYWPW